MVLQTKELKRSFNFQYFGSIDSSAKIAKGQKIGVNTYVMYLAPAETSGYNTCPNSTDLCRMACIFGTGRSKFDPKIPKARIERTISFIQDREVSMEKIIKEIRAAHRKSRREKMKFAVRLNGTSDINPLAFRYQGKNILEIFPRIQFYDYTKDHKRISVARNNSNYDLTFSYSGENWDVCQEMLDKGIRVSVVFNVKKGHPLPSHFNGYPVVDGDLTDYRPSDPNGCIVGLRYKTNRDKSLNEALRISKFVVQSDDIRCII
jgi:hypothetical protein